ALPVTAAYMIERQRQPRYSSADWQHEIMRRMTQRYTTGPIPWRPGAQQLLAQVHQRGIAQVVVSGTHRALLLSFLSRLHGLPFEFIIGGDEVAQPKPHPEAYLRAAQRLAVAIDDCLIIEDSVSGASAGNAAGAVVLAVPNVQSPPAAPRRITRDTLEGLDIDDLISIFEQGALQ
ncbi:MAG: HAD family hydrolase, partial [Propionibacteriaceae bacterium]